MIPLQTAWDVRIYVDFYMAAAEVCSPEALVKHEHIVGREAKTQFLLVEKNNRKLVPGYWDQPELSHTGKAGKS